MLDLALTLWCSLGAAAPPSSDEPSATEPGTAPVETPADEPAALPPSPLPRVVLVVDDDDAGTKLAAAIGAHLHGDVDLIVLGRDVAGLDLADLDRLARAQARRRGAVAVFWVRPEDDAHAVYLARPAHRELWVRRVTLDPEAPSAGLEAMGVIVRAATSAVLDDDPVGMEVTTPPSSRQTDPPETTPADPPAPVSSGPSRGRARLAVGYVGTTYAPGIPWLGGVEFAAAWVWPVGVHVGLDAAIHPRVELDVPEGRVEITRHPWAGRVGYDYRWKQLWLGADLGVVFDYPVRRATTRTPGLDADPDRGRLATGLAAGLRLGVVALWRLELFVLPRAEVWLWQTRYGVTDQDGTTRIVIDPRRFRASLVLGVAVRI